MKRAILPPDDETGLVRDFFADQTGFFVDVGANHPYDNSQTWHLEQAGWSGILIEPQSQLADLLRRTRAAKVYSVACSSGADAGKRLPFYLAGAHSSLSANLTDARLRPHGVIDVEVSSLDRMLSEQPDLYRIDFLSIDVEGHAGAVIEGIDLARWHPRLILVEDHVMDLRLHRLLSSRNYRWIMRTGLNSWYVPAADAPALGCFARWQFFRKYYLGTPLRRLRQAMRRLQMRRFTAGRAVHGEDLGLHTHQG